MSNDLLEGRIVFWEAGEGRVSIDLLAAPAGCSLALATPFNLSGGLPWSPLGVVILTTLHRWASRGERVRLERRTGREGAPQLRLSSGRTWLVLDLASQPAESAPPEMARAS